MIKNIRNNPGVSSYFRGRYRIYGLYQWNIKYYGFESDSEIEAAIYWAFGEYSYKTRSFDYLSDVIGRDVKAYIAGRSGGWLVIDTELTEKELNKVDEHIKSCMARLPEFLKEEREFRGSFEREGA